LFEIGTVVFIGGQAELFADLLGDSIEAQNGLLLEEHYFLSAVD
jgi:hypothetical protein